MWPISCGIFRRSTQHLRSHRTSQGKRKVWSRKFEKTALKIIMRDLSQGLACSFHQPVLGYTTKAFQYRLKPLWNCMGWSRAGKMKYRNHGSLRKETDRISFHEGLPRRGNPVTTTERGNCFYRDAFSYGSHQFYTDSVDYIFSLPILTSEKNGHNWGIYVILFSCAQLCVNKI